MEECQGKGICIRGFLFDIKPHCSAGNAFRGGIELKDLSYYDYLGHHDDVAKAVLKGEFDAGGIMEDTAYKFKDQGLKFLKISEDIPEFNVCVNKFVEQEEVSFSVSALTALSDTSAEGGLILKSIAKAYTGFTEAKDEDYGSVKAMLLKLGMLS